MSGTKDYQVQHQRAEEARRRAEEAERERQHELARLARAQALEEERRRKAVEEARRRAEEAEREHQRQLREQEENAKALRTEREALNARLQKERDQHLIAQQERLEALEAADWQRREQSEREYQERQGQAQARHAEQVAESERQSRELEEMRKATEAMSNQQYQMYQVMTKALKLEFSPRQIDLSDGTLKLRLEKIRDEEKKAEVIDVNVLTGEDHSEVKIHIQPGYDDKECERFAANIEASFAERGFDAQRTHGQANYQHIQQTNRARNRQSNG